MCNRDNNVFSVLCTCHKSPSHFLSSEKRSFYKSLFIWDYHVYMSVEKICQKLCPIQIGAIEELYIWQYYFNYVGDIIHSHILGVDQISTTDYVENRDFFAPTPTPLSHIQTFLLKQFSICLFWNLIFNRISVYSCSLIMFSIMSNRIYFEYWPEL